MSFKQIVVADFEYECKVGGLPDVLCMVAHVLNGKNFQHMQTIRMWRGEFGSVPPFDIGDDSFADFVLAFGPLGIVAKQKVLFSPATLQ